MAYKMGSALWSKGSFSLFRRALHYDGKAAASESQIKSAAKDIFAFRDSGAWAIGDLVVYAESIGKEDAIASVAEAIVKDRNWVRKCFYVSKAIAEQAREFDLWWTFYYAVYTFPEDVRARLLKMAEDNAWNLDEFKAHLRSLRTSVRAQMQKFPEGTYGLIYADPPWKYDNAGEAGSGFNGAAVNHYPPMELDEIKALADPQGRSVCDLSAQDCILYLWATAPFLESAMAVMAAWGFEYKTGMIWEKDIPGNGFWSRVRHEHLLIGTKGTPIPPDASQLPDSIIVAPKGGHSEKPGVVYDLLEELYPKLPRVELFQRGESREGWDVWGNQSGESSAADLAADAAKQAPEDSGDDGSDDAPDADQEQRAREAKAGKKKRKPEPKARTSDSGKPRLVHGAKKTAKKTDARKSA